MRRIGVFGGSFDPPHTAHHALALAAIEQFALDELRVIPTGQAWHKDRALSAGAHRLAMAQLAFADIPQVVVDDLELRRAGPSYTVETLQALHKEQPQSQFWLFIGADQARAFTSWHQWEKILQMAHLVVADRPHDAPDKPPSWQNEHLLHVQQLQMPSLDVSATAIRDAIRDTLAASLVTNALAPSVLSYIDQHRLYTRHP